MAIISVSNLNKSFRLYAKPADRLKEVLFPWRAWHAPFHALKDITFEIRRGEHVGILGVNGAGKSTLLQILSGVLTPTSGEVTVRGRVAALLELGAGFNALLSGRDNVIFQMQLHGLSDEAIDDKVSAVETFAEVGDFFDQPMHTYSSGMFMRVAFASAILADPDILIVDEALAVGDTRFQKKCYDRLNALKDKGTTVILVTHDIFGAKAHCSRLLLLHKGELLANGDPDDVVTRYMHILYPPTQAPDLNDVIGKSNDAPVSSVDSALEQNVLHVDLSKVTGRWGRGGATLEAMRFFGLLPPNRFQKGHQIVIECDYRLDPSALSALAASERVVPQLAVGMRIDAGNGLPLCDFSSAVIDGGTLDLDISKETFATFRFAGTLPNLAPGDYFFTPAVSIGQKDSYVPVTVCENAAVLQCERTELILGLFKPEYSVVRIA